MILEVEATEVAVERGVEDVSFWLGNRNSDIEKGNNGLRNSIKGVWEVKRRQLEEGFGATDSVLAKLNIPLHQDPDARVKPIEIKERPLRTVIPKPGATTSAEPNLNHEDVKGLVDFIDQYARQFEVAPKSYDRMDEENLRDLLVGMMNANFPGSTTGETFSKLGKTNISFRVDSGHVLICECKFWTGAAAYAVALDQLFGYVTWRQNYGVLINFSKLKGMTRAVSEATRTSSEHPSFTAGSLVLQRQFREGCGVMPAWRRGAWHGSVWPVRYCPAYPQATAATRLARTVPGAAFPAPPGRPAAS